jgi:HEAT repeat protein
MDDAALLPIVKDPAQPLWKRVFATGWAGKLTSPESAALLAEAAAGGSQQPAAVRQAAILSLGLRQSSFGLLKGIADATKEPWRLRVAAAWALGKSADPGALTTLKALLNEDQKALKAQAIDSLAALKAKEAVDALVALLPKRDSQEVRSNILSAIGQLGDQTTADSLTAMAGKTPDLRRPVIPVVARISRTKAIPALAGFFDGAAPKGAKDADWPIRLDVCESLAGMDDPAAFALLQKAVVDVHASVRASAIRAIASVASDERRNLVRSLVDSSDKDVSRSAIRALGANRSPESKVKFLEILKSTDRSKEVRWAAIEALAEYRDAGVAQALLATLRQETDSNLRADTLDSLSVQSTPGARAAVELALKDQDSYVAGRAARVWRRLNGIKACSSTLNALLERKDGSAAEKLVNTLTLPGCRDKGSLGQVAARFGAGDAGLDGEIARLLKSWSGQDFGTDKEKWLAWSTQGIAGR